MNFKNFFVQKVTQIVKQGVQSVNTVKDESIFKDDVY